MPTITKTVPIDGTSQTGYSGSPIIELNGASAGIADGFAIQANDSIQGLSIVSFDGAAISIDGASGATISGNYLGVLPGGTSFGSNTIGVEIDGGARNNTIGGLTAAKRNVIAGGHYSISIDGISSGPQTSDNVIEGNYIGTNASGATAKQASYDIVIAGGAQNNTIGGTTAAARNVLAGSEYAGVQIEGIPTGPQTTGNVVEGNYIGINAAGTAALPNDVGVSIVFGAQNNTIGGAIAGTRNVISGNTSNGVEIDGSSTSRTPPAIAFRATISAQIPPARLPSPI